MAMSHYWLATFRRIVHCLCMRTPVGPSLRIVMELSDAFAEVSLSTARNGWERWFGPGRFQRKLAQLEARGWLQRVARPGNVERIVRLTEAGRLAALGGRDPEASWRRPWDGRWRLAMFDIPESKSALRQKLWRQLRSLGFGYLQHSVWISPDSTTTLKNLLEGATSDVETFTLMEARPCAGDSDTDLTNGAWDFARINRNYRIYQKVLESQPAKQSGKSWRAWLETEWKAWDRALKEDPLLPESLLPSGYLGKETWHHRQISLKRLLRPTG